MKKRTQAMPDHRGKFSLTYVGLYVLKKAFSEGALILVDMGTTSICPTILMLSYRTLHEGASKCNLFFYIPM